MDENQVLTEVQEGVVNPIVEEVSKSSNNVLIKVVAGVVLAGAAIGGAILFKKHRNKKQQKVEATIEVSEEPEIIENDETKISE